MASRFGESCSPLVYFLDGKVELWRLRTAVRPMRAWRGLPLTTLFALVIASVSSAQVLLKSTQPGEAVLLMPSDATVLEAEQERKDLPCSVTQRKPDLGFDLRFHAGFDVSIPLSELAGEGQLLTVIFRVVPADNNMRASNFVQHFVVPAINEDAKGDATLQGVIDLGEGSYHVEWLMRDKDERVCSTNWDVDADLSPKDKPIPLFLSRNRVEQAKAEPFFNEPVAKESPRSREYNLNVKLLVNFAPQNAVSAALQRSDTDALVSILKAIERDPRVAHVSLVAFNMNEARVVYRQEAGDQIDFPALGKALHQMKLGTVNLQALSDKHSNTDFLESLITKEVAPAHTDAVIFAGPKAMLDANVPQEDLRRIGDIDCPVFYMNYTLDPQATPWKDSISHAIHTFKGTEFTISRPRDLWFSTVEMFSRIIRFKKEHALAGLATGGSQ